MNIVVVLERSENEHSFINAATNWVRTHPVDRMLYSVGVTGDVRIGPYNIRFVHRPDNLLGLRIDIVYYYDMLIEDSRTREIMAREIECRMVPGGKTYINLHLFMKEVFQRAENEVAIARRKLLNGIYGIKAVNYPEDFIAKIKESQKKMDDRYVSIDFAEIYRAKRDQLMEKMFRQCYIPVGRIKEEKTMNCDIRSSIKDVIFSYPATIILWKDGTKTIVKAGKNDKYDPEKGFAMAVCKKMFGNEGNYYEVFKEYVPIPYYIPEKNDIIVKDLDVAEEANKIIEDIIIKWRLKHKEWPGLTRRKWKELINKVAKRVEERRKREKAKADHKEKQKGIRSGKYHFGIDLSNYMTPPEEGVNSSDKEE